MKKGFFSLCRKRTRFNNNWRIVYLMLKVICPHIEPEFPFSLQIRKKETKELLNQPSIGDKIVETLSSTEVNLENKTIHNPPLHSKLQSLMFFLMVAWTAAQQCIEGEGKLYFPFLTCESSEGHFRANSLN